MILTRLGALDQRLFDRAQRSDTPALDRVLPRLTSSADHGGLWLATAAVLAVTGQRRAAVRGLTSLAVASALANGPLKLGARRPRPLLSPVPVPRQLLRQPTTSSFPSGHSASAAAFATGVALESPLLAAPVGLLAAGVAYGRVHTGVHFPGDVAAGLALGAGAALVVRRSWPVRPERPAVAERTRSEAPALPDGEGLVVVLNESAGSGDRADEVEATLMRELPAAKVVRCTDDVEQCLRDAAASARVLGVVGGDGTVNCAAGVAMEAGLPLAVVPGGTLDHFAGELGIGSVEVVCAAGRDGEAVRVSMGSAGEGLHFLNTFAVGVYPDLVHEREKYEARLGKWPAMALALVRVLPRAQEVVVEVDGQPRRLWTLFAGNGHYHPSGFAPSWRERMDSGTVDVRMVSAEAPLARTRLVLAVLTGRLGRSRVYSEQVVRRLEVTSGAGLRLARDGEVQEGPERLVLQATDTLAVYRPA